MSRIKKSLANGWVATIVVAAIAVVAAWQFYLFATFKDSQGVFDAGGGTGHLWLALGAAAVACVAGFLAFSVAVEHNEANDMHINS
jgi:predicted RNA methylase